MMLQRTLFFIVMVLCPLAPVWAEDWPQWRGPERTGISKEKGLLQSWPPNGPKLLWTFRDAGAGLSGMSIVGDRLYTMGAEDDKEYVYAIDLKNRKKLWSVEVGAPYINDWVKGPTSTPTIDGNFLYALGGHGNLVCLERTSGRKVWSQDLVADLGGAQPSDSYSESPLVDGDLVVVTPGGDDGKIAAFDKKTGDLKWRSPAYTGKRDVCNASMIAITVRGVRQYVQMTWGTVAGVRASDGELLWYFEAGTGLTTPICRKNYVYAPLGYGSGSSSCLLLKLLPDGDKFKAKQIYANKEMQNDHGGVILVGNHIYGFSWKGGWICQHFKTGKTVWKENHRMGQGSVIYADGNLYCYHEKKGDMLLLKATPDGYKEQGKFRIPEESQLPRDSGKIWTHPAVANGKLYLRDQELIFCYDVRKPQ